LPRITRMRSPMQAVMKFLALALAALVAGCDPQLPSKVSAQADELAAIKQRTAALEANTSALEQTVRKLQQSPPGNWTLWQVTESVNAGYPQAFSAYPSKSECLTAAAGWSYEGGKRVAEDPTIWQMKGYRMRLECLPVGVSPYAH
jgi:hypothetical protein